MEMDAILTETLACFLPGQAKDLSVSQVLFSVITSKCTIIKYIKIFSNIINFAFVGYNI